jgi:hypothetical protein
MELTVYEIGSDVMVNKGVIDAKISAILIRGDHVKYEIVFWDGATRKTEWVEPNEICGKATAKARIGWL